MTLFSCCFCFEGPEDKVKLGWEYVAYADRIRIRDRRQFETNYEHAIKLFEEAARAGSIEGQCAAGQISYLYSKHVRLYDPKRRDPNIVGMNYSYHKSLENQGFSYLRSAANKGNQIAKDKLAQFRKEKAERIEAEKKAEERLALAKQKDEERRQEKLALARKAEAERRIQAEQEFRKQQERERLEREKKAEEKLKYYEEHPEALVEDLMNAAEEEQRKREEEQRLREEEQQRLIAEQAALYQQHLAYQQRQINEQAALLEQLKREANFAYYEQERKKLLKGAKLQIKLG